MHKRGLVAAVLIAASFGAAQARAETQYMLVHAGTLIAVPGEAPRKTATIIVKDGKIAEIRDGYIDAAAIADAKPDQVSVVNLESSYVLPGLIDSHVHLTGQVSRDSQLEGVTVSDPAGVTDSVLYAGRTLFAGFTTVRDAGGDLASITALRNATRDGKVAGPRIIAAGEPLSPTGGHADQNGYRMDVFATPSPAICNGADDCRRAVRYQVKYGANLIKIMATGGVLDDSGAGVEQQFTDEEMKAIVETAHQLGRKVAAHAHGAMGIKAAVRAGVDSIEHGTFLDDEGAALMKKNGTYLVPTLMAGDFVLGKAEIEGYFPPQIRDKARFVGKKFGQQVAKALAAGVKIAFGTDTCVSPHGLNAHEFTLLVKNGMTPAAAIRAATVSAADLLGVSKDAGSIEPGKSADLVATAKDPLADVSELEHVVFVMKAGKIYRSANPAEATGWLPSPPAGD